MDKLKWLLIIVIIIAAFLRLYNITVTPPGLYPDEAMNGNNALEGFKVFYPENNGREGLFINIQALSLIIFGNQPWALRLPSAIFGILTVLGVYFLTKELFSKKIALLSTFLIATSFWHINFSRIGFRAIMAPFFITWALYFLLKALNSEKYKLSSILSGLSLGLGFHSYIAFRAMPALVIVVWILYWIKNKDSALRKKIILSACLVSLTALIAFAPLGLYFLKNPAAFFGRTTQVSVFSSPTMLKDLSVNILATAAMFNFYGDANWRHNYAGAPELFWPVGFLFLIGIFGGLGLFLAKIFPRSNSNFQENHLQSFIILFSWLIIAALPVVISNEGMPHALRAILMIPPAIILAAVGGFWLYEKLSIKLPKTLLSTICYLLFTALIFEAYNTYFIKWGQNYNVQGAFAADYVAMGRELNALPKELPKYVVVEAPGVSVRGIPMPTQTIMFITDTFTPEKQKEKNIHYILPNQISQIPPDSYVVTLK